MHSRRLALEAILRKVKGKRLGGKIAKNEEANRLMLEALQLDVENDDQFRMFVEKMERVVDLLKLKVRE